MRVVTARRMLPLGVAVTGVVLAHAADYAIAFPDPASRQNVMTATGHGYWPVAVVLAALAGACAVACAARRGVLDGHTAIGEGLLAGGRRLALWQVALFVVLETVERVGAGVDPIPFLHSAQLALGVGLQVVVATIAVLVLRAVEQTARRIAEHLRRPRPASTPARSWAMPADDAAVTWCGWAGEARGPPLLALT